MPSIPSERTSRRKFLAGCSALALAGAISPGTLLAARPGRNTASLDRISFGHFSGQVGTVFRVGTANEAAANLVLLEATENETTARASARAFDAANEKFSLLFMGAPETALEQDTYVFEHPRLGQFAMFIVPLHSESGDYSWYEAVFNRRPVAVRAQRNS